MRHPFNIATPATPMSLASTSPSSRPWIETLRRADWLDADRARGYRNILLILTGAAIVIWTALAVVWKSVSR